MWKEVKTEIKFNGHGEAFFMMSLVSSRENYTVRKRFPKGLFQLLGGMRDNF